MSGETLKLPDPPSGLGAVAQKYLQQLVRELKMNVARNTPGANRDVGIELMMMGGEAEPVEDYSLLFMQGGDGQGQEALDSVVGLEVMVAMAATHEEVS